MPCASFESVFQLFQFVFELTCCDIGFGGALQGPSQGSGFGQGVVCKVHNLIQGNCILNLFCPSIGVGHAGRGAGGGHWPMGPAGPSRTKQN